VINAANQVVATIPVGNLPSGVTVNQASGTVYVSCSGDGTVWVISPSTESPFFVVPVGNFPQGLAYDVANGGVYVANEVDDTASIIFGP
jgi:YVTN family beta-propeller protein